MIKGPELSRREFVGDILKLGIAIPFSSFEIQAPSNEEDPVTLRKKQIEDKYGIVLFSQEDFIKSISSGRFTPDVNPPNKWDIGRINLVDKALSNLPAHFRDINEDGKLYISFNSGIGGGCCIAGGGKEGRGLLIGYDTFKPENEEQAISVLTHELIHVLTSGKEAESKEYGYKNLTRDIEDIFQDKFSSVSTTYHDQLKPEQMHYILKFVNDLMLSKEDKKRAEMIARLEYGLRITEPKEFIAVMGEEFILGSDHFKSSYGGIFTPEIANNLYSLMRDKIFKCEYRDGILVGS